MYTLLCLINLIQRNLAWATSHLLELGLVQHLRLGLRPVQANGRNCRAWDATEDVVGITGLSVLGRVSYKRLRLALVNISSTITRLHPYVPLLLRHRGPPIVQLM